MMSEQQLVQLTSRKQYLHMSPFGAKLSLLVHEMLLQLLQLCFSSLNLWSNNLPGWPVTHTVNSSAKA